MSLINEMLRDLDRRQALAAHGQLPPGQVRVVAARPPSRQWFWTLVAGLMLVALAWVAWVAYQVHARPLATDLAFRSAEERKARPPEQQVAAAPAPQVAAAPAPQAAPSAPSQPAQAPAPAEPQPQAEAAKQPEAAPSPPELFKFAPIIETPIAASKPAPAPAAESKPAPAPVAESKPKPAASPPAALPKRSKAPVASAEPAVTRRDLPRPPAEQAEAQFRQGVALLNQGRVSEAQEQFGGALARHAGHQAARQALVAILIERGRLEDARHLLEEGLALHPGNLQFASVLARLLVERREYANAANVLAGAQPAGAGDADYQVLQGAVFQKLGRHAEATTAFDQAAKLKPQPGTTWLAMALSLEATGRKADALDAYRRALGGNSLSQEARSYAEGRVRSLR